MIWAVGKEHPKPKLNCKTVRYTINKQESRNYLGNTYNSAHANKP